VSGAFVGTSGWSYPSWRPGFYPAAVAPDDFLRHYAGHLPAVELNATAYRLPAEEQFHRWAQQVPDGFRFAVKAPPGTMRRIGFVEERVRALGDRLGCVRLVVSNRRDDGLLELLLGSVDPAVRWALDLRHPSWDGVESRLAQAGVVRVDDWEARPSWRYLRFREPPHTDDDLRRIAARIAPLVASGIDVFAFFRHEDAPTAPAYAERVRDLLDEGKAHQASSSVTALENTSV
jgi:uncharacterized protein YecE (DUF72 family)